MLKEQKPRKVTGESKDNGDAQGAKDKKQKVVGDKKENLPRVPKSIWKDGPSGEYATLVEARRQLREGWLADKLPPIEKAVRNVNK